MARVQVTAISPAVDQPWGLRVSRPVEGTLAVQLSGSWRLRDRLPDGADVRRKLDSGPPVRRLAFETRDVTGWDSGLLTLLWELVETSRRAGIDLDPAGLPPGVQRLLSLVSASQLQELVRAASRPPWVDRVGRAALAAGAEAGRMLAFVGDLNAKVNRLVASVLQTAEQFKAAAEKTQRTLQEVDGALTEETPLGEQMRVAIRELTGASRSIRTLADYLKEHPGAVVWGKGRVGS